MSAPEYVLARRVLLDAFVALAEQRDAVVLVGAQAIYLTVGDADLATPPMTTDGDLAVDPRQLADIPIIADAMSSGGFVPTDQPGSWRGFGDVLVDLMVPGALAVNAGRRSVDLGVHGRRAARVTPGWRLLALAEDAVAGPATRVAMEHLDSVFLRRDAVGPEMAARAAAPAERADVIRASTAVLAGHLGAALRR